MRPGLVLIATLSELCVGYTVPDAHLKSQDLLGRITVLQCPTTPEGASLPARDTWGIHQNLWLTVPFRCNRSGTVQGLARRPERRTHHSSKPVRAESQAPCELRGSRAIRYSSACR